MLLRRVYHLQPPQPFSEISVFQDSQLSLAFAGGAKQSLIPESGEGAKHSGLGIFHLDF